MSAFENIAAFIANKDIKLGQKWAIALICLVAVIMINKYTGFSFFLYQNSKVDALKSIEETKKITNNPDILKELAIIEHDIITHERHHFSYLSSLFLSDEISSDSIDCITSQEQNIKPTKAKNEISGGHEAIGILDILSSSYIWLFMILGSFFFLFSETKVSFSERLATVILIIVICLFFTSLYTYGFYHAIPQFEHRWINYMINAIGSVMITGIVFYPFTNNKKTKT